MSSRDAPVQGRGFRRLSAQPASDGGRRSTVIRIVVAVLVAALATAAAILLLHRANPPRTDVVGYPIFNDFNVQNYFTAYYAIVGLFPLAAVFVFLLLTRLGPRIGLDARPSRGRLRPPLPSGTAPPRHEPPRDETLPIVRWIAAGGQAVFVGAVLGLEIGIVIDHVWLGLAIGSAAYVSTIALLAAISGRLTGGKWSLQTRLACANAIGAPLTIVGMVLVSSHTAVSVVSDRSVHHYPWLPAWVGVPIAVGLSGFVAMRIRRATGEGRVRAIQRWVLLLLVAPLGVFLLMAGLPGDLGPIEMFESGQGLVGAKLVGEGWLPWRDVVLAHGLLLDAGIPAVGEAVFGSSQWGRSAGYSLLTAPLFLAIMFLLFVYLFRRDTPFLIFSGLVLVGTSYVPADVRFLPWPLVLLLLAALLDRPTTPRAVALGLLTVGLAIVTPEAVPAVPAVALMLVLRDWYWRKPGISIAVAFERTLWFAGAAVVSAAAFAVYMASRGGFDDFIYITVSLVPGHALSGGVPPNPIHQASNLRFGFEALAPVAALLIAFAYGVARLRSRKPFLNEDWVMGAVAVFLLFYYLKFLSYMDFPHLIQVFEIALPLMLFIVYRALAGANRWVGRRFQPHPAGRIFVHPVSFALALAFVPVAWGQFGDRVTNAPAMYRPAVATEPVSPKVGYSSDPYDPVMYRDLKRVIDSYLRPSDRLFDFTNAPTLYYYLLDRDPSTRYLVVLIAHTDNLQKDVVSELRHAPPKLIVFDSASAGLPNWDGIPNMVRHYVVSSWILAHYRPLLATHGTTIYARRDMPSPARLGLRLSKGPITHGVEFQGQPCTWGDIPNFLASARALEPGKGSVRARIGSPQAQVTVSGWAGDPGAAKPADRVVAVIGGKVVAQVRPQVERPDLPAAGLPAGYVRSGFEMTVPLPSPGARRKLRIVAISRQGARTELAIGGGTASARSLRLGQRVVPLDRSAVQGAVDTEVPATTLRIAVPAGSSWRDYRWLEINAGPQGFGEGAFSLYDLGNRPSPGREISFQTIAGSPSTYNVPVSSCPQWHGYRSRRLFLTYSPDQGIASVKLIR